MYQISAMKYDLNAELLLGQPVPSAVASPCTTHNVTLRVIRLTQCLHGHEQLHINNKDTLRQCAK